MTAVDRLLEISAGPLADDPVAGLPTSALGDELKALLRRRNGFVAFEGALVVRAAGDGPSGLARWNDPRGWRATYGDLADGLFCFAADAFGGQFALRDGDVVVFEPETGQTRPLATSLEGWARAVLDDHEYLTGHPVARAWQLANHPLTPGKRLVPKRPFVLGGEYAVDNLYELDEEAAMTLRGDLATQLRDLPDGADVEIVVRD